MASNVAIPDEIIINKIYLIRGLKVMLDRDLAEMYGVETKRLKEAVRRNIDRFPKDFMFILRKNEMDALRTHFATLKRGEHFKYLPYAFTEQGVAMLSGILNSTVAIQVNIKIMRIFTRMREMLLTHKDILLKLEIIERKISKHDEEISLVFKALKQLLPEPKPEPRRRIGFKTD